jgi:single-stranded-DNA-specific exonuclease
MLGALLRNRGLTDVARARAWLDPRLRDLSHPADILDLERAAERVRRACRDKERIVVYGDYDVDGMTGTVILMNFIRLAGGQVDHYIPNRLKEGYSFNDAAIDTILSGADRPGLVLTVDHGISANEGIARLANEGVDVVVTDHHEPPAVLPDRAYALVNPRRPDCPSRFKSLCGAAVAYKLAWGAAESFTGQRKVSSEFREFLLEAMGLVSLATVTDVVPLVDENRILCFHGLRALPVSKNPGIQALLAASRLRGQAVRAVHVAYRIGPRINAAGRMGIAEVAIELLTTRDVKRAKALARRLEDANDRRRVLEKEVLSEILSMPQITDRQPGQGICVGKPGWHPGVIGIVAARLVDRFDVPAVVVALDGEKSRASARSVEGVNVKVALDGCADHLRQHGGHAGAAGATLDEDAFPGFQSAFAEVSARAVADSGVTPSLNVDLELPFSAIRPEFVEELERLAPHGEANPTALFCTKGAVVCGRPKRVGKDRGHLAFHVRHGERTFRAFGRGMADQLELLRTDGACIDMAYRLKFDTYLDPGSIELEIEELRLNNGDART